MGQNGGRFLGLRGRRRIGRWTLVALLAGWDSLLLYMIAGGLIQPVYGGAFVALVSIYLGIQFWEVLS